MLGSDELGGVVLLLSSRRQQENHAAELLIGGHPAGIKTAFDECGRGVAEGGTLLVSDRVYDTRLRNGLGMREVS